ncbi:MAG: DUF4214 domain-containing protein [Acidimicrobiales bacterium]
MWNDEVVRRVVLAVLLVVSLVGLAIPASAETAPIDSLAESRIRVTTRLVGLAADVDGGRTDLSANGQFVIFDRSGTGIGVFDSVRNQTVVLGDDTARPFAVSDSGGIALYTNLGQPYRWDRATGENLALPWSGGVITDMALDQGGAVVAYTEQTGGSTGVMRIWTAERLRQFGATVTPSPARDDRDVFISADGRTALFRSGSGIRRVEVSSGIASFSLLTSLTGLDRAGSLQVEEGDGFPVRFRIGGTNTTDRTEVNFPAPVNNNLSGVAIAGSGASVLFHSQDELYRWQTNGELHYLQPLTSSALGAPRDASITGRFVLTSRPGATNGILEIVDVSGPQIPNVDRDSLQGPQLGDQIRRLYLAYFDREPDAAGFAAWKVVRATGASLDAVSAEFAASTEFQNTYGALDNGAFVDLVYNNVLGRDPDGAGRAFWIGQLEAGATRGSVMTGFSEGEEFRGRTGTTAAADAPTAFQIERLYRAYFDRPADQGGLDFWLEQFAGGADLGTLSQEFAGSTEFQNTYGALDNAGFVDLVYLNVLGRLPDDAGRAFWLDRLDTETNTRGQVMIGFSESPEFIIATDTLPD